MTATPTLDELIRINTQDMLESFGLGATQRGRRLLEWACAWPARRFALTVLEYDRRVQVEGLQLAAIWALQQFSVQVELIGRHHVPATGPVLFLSNHPGIADTLALFATLPRADLYTVAAIRPFLISLPNMARRLIFVPEDNASQLGVVRTVAGRLREGAAILTFPAGRIEPDPDLLPGAEAALESWSSSIDLFARLAPATRLVPLLVAGVFSPRSLTNPLLRLRRRQDDKERLAAMLQVINPVRYPVHVTVTAGPPLAAEDVTSRGGRSAREAVIETMRGLMRQSRVTMPGSASALTDHPATA
ncbi:MAG: 1-acyl-sn-glycerol-3-phosphate acyltransferase [Caldilineaceae bacterium]|nr:1-acyl-sn-glycerol-3-phosphate acyltransferase [Caldilineaceae bacterium]